MPSADLDVDDLPSTETADGREHADRAKGHKTEDGDLRPWRIVCWCILRISQRVHVDIFEVFSPRYQDIQRTGPTLIVARLTILGRWV